jgi:uncharacterized membrane protein
MAASKVISAQKGATSFLTVLVSYAVTVGAQALAKAVGVDVPAEMQAQVTVAVTAGIAGVITAGLNWLKHSKKPK